MLAAPAAEPVTLEKQVVFGKAEDLPGTAPSATKGQASREELVDRPLLRRGELLEAVPGVIITQHSGGGKANQYFLRVSISTTARTSAFTSTGCR